MTAAPVRPDPPRRARPHPLGAAALGVVGVLAASVGALATLAALSGYRDAQVDRAQARVAADNVELIVQARRDEALGQASLARTPAEDADLAEELDALVAGRPAVADVADVLRQRERALLEAIERTGSVDGRLSASVTSGLDELQRAGVRPHDAEVASAERTARRTAVGAAIVPALAWIAALVLGRPRRATAS